MGESATEYNNILLLTDLTEKSQAALGYARAFAQFYNSYLGVLHVLPEPKPDPLGSGGDNGNAAVVRKRLETLAKALRAEGIGVQIRLCRGAVASGTLLRNIRAMRPDLIIQGCGAIGDFRRPFIGSIAEEVLRSTDKPVLTVATRLKAPSSRSLRFTRIMLATDFGSAVRTASSHALSLAQEFGAQVYLCHVRKRNKSEAEISTFFCNELDRLVDSSATDFCTPRSVVKFGKPWETILKLAKTEKCDLIVLGAHGLGPLGSRGKPGTVFRVISGAHCPVLTVSSVKRDDTADNTEQIEFIEA
jgi:nucleotide-binding universal stress UspA family protein